MWHVRKLAFALKFRCCNLRNLFCLLYDASIFSEIKSKILLLLKVILCIVKMGHQSRVAKYTMFESLWLLNLDHFQLSFCLRSWRVLWNGSNAMKPMWQDGEIRACFQPVFPWAEAHWVQHPSDWGWWRCSRTSAETSASRGSQVLFLRRLNIPRHSIHWPLLADKF